MVRFGNPVERKGSQTQAKESEAHPPPLLGVPQKTSSCTTITYIQRT